MGGIIDSDGDLSVNNHDTYEMSFSALVKYAAKDKKFILIADSHNNANATIVPISKDSIATMASLGVKHILFEISNKAQRDVDAFYEGKFSYEKLAETYEKTFSRPWLKAEDNRRVGKALAEMLRDAKEAGIKVHYVDTLEPEPVALKNPEMAKLWDKVAGKSPEEIMAIFDEVRKTNPNINKQFKDYVQTMMDERFARDIPIAENMKEMAKDGKVAMIYGGNHFAKASDINEFVGKKDAVVIAMEQSWEPSNSVRNVPDEDLPNYVFFTDSLADDGRIIQEAAKIQSNNNRSEACKRAVDATKPVYYLIGCTMEDAELKSLSQLLAPVQIPAKTGQPAPQLTPAK